MRHFIRSAAVAIAMATASTFTLSAAIAADLSGAGSTFIYPVFAKWADTYKKDTGIGLNYQSIGSGGGIKQVIAKTVTFGATDKPMSDADLEKNGLVQFPMVMGGIVPIINLTGVKPGELVLDGKTLAQIYLGAITTWDDAAIKALNPGLTLPSTAIAVVHRSDGSGTTFNFTNYLVKLSPDWKDKVGSDSAVEWPTGVGAKGSEGVANTVKQTDGGIGYVEYAYAKQNNLSYSKMLNAAGKVVEPSLESFGAAASNADFKGAKNFNVIITNEPGDTTWPIAASTWVLIHKAPDDAAATGEALKFFAWAYKDGKETAKALDYVSIPDSVVDLVKASWKADIQAGGKPVYVGE
ncbi:phosphate ABC transporter substrate-binding protein PstS [Mesorhizobium sp. WSM4312]|uniref:phosphate ABC transporter substrate-binding protein PstS n=1 Tax=unclassified Mesorhizobium TaxID=325217 RepID=UPI000BAEBCB0|nr:MULTISPECIES: phosphate ABC transporter substrate-binding protein PstS [unclassified Mesorhizobium]PBB26584.1 phosphate ABC transporter substrate-binding protein PstS [Mesorhizobium sp. WSM4304]PBB68509.1 phosphate ABC transporter substrate-binding protein PstS [Mesorhizobium sp. WSM4312]PBB76185.1 phosphate ABC transporter substrate-binding protein PstS [Mesorhizobium sp. WSM4308]PBC20450.1 phosphate ABC transporter substrate-binding protein PstS [Mesorhizobium sp. WSM4311]TRC73159.1 phosp